MLPGDVVGERAGVRGKRTVRMDHQQKQHDTALRHRRELRERSTEAESLMWYMLRARRLAGLKFRRQYSIGPFIVDFACVEKRTVVELDGDYHDHIYEKDLERQRWLERNGWRIIRFSNTEVLEDVEAVAIAIKRHLSLDSPSPQPSPPK